MDRLDELEYKSIYIIREANKRFGKLALLWSIGKDSTVLLYLARKAFFGKIPFPTMTIDTKNNFKEMHTYREKLTKKWNLDLKIRMYGEKCIDPKNEVKGVDVCCGAPKTESLKNSIKEFGFNALLVGIRRDEHGIRAKERYFSPRDEKFTWDYKNQPAELWDQYTSKQEEETHLRVHPLLHWTEKDIWLYIQRENIPILDLYFSKNGKRYRSLGCKKCSVPVNSNASTVKEIIEEIETSHEGERHGRSTEKEKDFVMQKLRGLGYM